MDEFARRLDRNERSRKLVAKTGGDLARLNGNEEKARQIEELAKNPSFQITEIAEAGTQALAEALGFEKKGGALLISKVVGALVDAKLGKYLDPKIGQAVGLAFTTTKGIMEIQEEDELRRKRLTDYQKIGYVGKYY